MAITHNVDILKLTVLNDGTDLVSEIDVEITSVDDSDPSNLTRTSYDRFLIDTSGGTSAADLYHMVVYQRMLLRVGYQQNLLQVR